jgi:hypothetical protein
LLFHPPALSLTSIAWFLRLNELELSFRSKRSESLPEPAEGFFFPTDKFTAVILSEARRTQ